MTNSNERSGNNNKDHKQNVPELRFPGFEDEWLHYKLSDFGDFKNGVNKSKNDFGSGYSFVNLEDILEKRYLYNKSFGLVKVSQKELNEYNLKKGDVLFVRSSVKPEGVGLTSVLLEDLNNTVYSGFIIRYRTNKKLNISFKKYCFSTFTIRKQILAKSSTSANTNINQQSLKKIDFNVPSLDEQKKIADFLSLIDKKIELMEKKYQMLINLKKYFLHNMISSYKEINPPLRFNEFKENWNKIRLKENLDLIRNGSSETQVNYETDYPVSRIETVSGDKLNLDKVGYVEHIGEEYKIKKGDIMLTNINSMKFIGNVLYFNTNETLYHGMNLLLLRFNENINKKFMFYNLKRNNILFKKMACQAVNQASINKTTIEKMQFNIPSIKEQEKIAEFLFHFDKKIENIYKQIQLNTNFKKSLLSKMFC
ncbi:MAG: restriction endonuclease subunit S [Methanosphaera sp.]|nr:restriction endonuclease subunit S [Methanosphaera sp.]